MEHPPKAIFVIPELRFAERVSYCCKPCLLATSVPSHVAVFEAQITLRQGEYARLEQGGAYHASVQTATLLGIGLSLGCGLRYRQVLFRITAPLTARRTEHETIGRFMGSRTVANVFNSRRPWLEM